VVLKRLDLARIGSKRTAHLRHTGLEEACWGEPPCWDSFEWHTCHWIEFGTSLS